MLFLPSSAESEATNRRSCPDWWAAPNLSDRGGKGGRAKKAESSAEKSATKLGRQAGTTYLAESVIILASGSRLRCLLTGKISSSICGS